MYRFPFTLDQFLLDNIGNLSELESKFPVKIDIPINFSLYFNL
jgi:hypothetical protein